MTAESYVIHEPEKTSRTTPALLAIIRDARTGNDAAFEEIMLLTERRVAQISWAILRDTDEVKDATQETFLRLFRHLGRYDESRDFVAWLSHIAVNVCRDALRRRKSQRIFEPLDPAAAGASGETRADDDLIHRDHQAILGRAIDLLPPKERLAVILRDIEGMRTEDVAAALGSTVGTVRVQLSRARIKLRHRIQSWLGGTKP